MFFDITQRKHHHFSHKNLLLFQVGSGLYLAHPLCKLTCLLPISFYPLKTLIHNHTDICIYAIMPPYVCGILNL